MMPVCAALHIPIGILQQTQNDVLDVFADVAGFGQRGRIDNRERHIQNARQRLRQQCLAGSRRPDQQNIRFRQLDFAAALLVHLNPLVVVVNRNRQLLLGGILTDYVLIQIFLQFQRTRQLAGRAVALLVPIVFNDRVANRNALVTNVSPRVIARGRDELTDDVLAFVAERTAEGIVRSGALQTGSPT